MTAKVDLRHEKTRRRMHPTVIDMRGYRLFVPADCSASIDADEHAKALQYMERVLQADTRPAAAVAAWLPAALRAGSD